MNLRGILAAGIVMVAAAGCASTPTGEPHPGGLPETADAFIPDGSKAREFSDVAALAATADLVVHGRVTAVEAGEPQLLPDGSAEMHTPRWLVVEVADKLLVRGTVAEPATSLRVYDGFWSDGVGYRLDAYDWARPGDEGYFFLSRDEAPDGTPLDTYTPLGSEGRVLLGLRTTVYDASDTSVWSTALGSSATAATVRQTVDRAVDRARSGDAKPVLVEVCRPSDPDDESSEPICEME